MREVSLKRNLARQQALLSLKRMRYKFTFEEKVAKRMLLHCFDMGVSVSDWVDHLMSFQALPLATLKNRRKLVDGLVDVSDDEDNVVMEGTESEDTQTSSGSEDEEEPWSDLENVFEFEPTKSAQPAEPTKPAESVEPAEPAAEPRKLAEPPEPADPTDPAHPADLSDPPELSQRGTGKKSRVVPQYVALSLSNLQELVSFLCRPCENCQGQWEYINRAPVFLGLSFILLMKCPNCGLQNHFCLISDRITQSRRWCLSIVAGGLTYSHMDMFCRLFGLYNISESQFYEIQSQYIVPATEMTVAQK